MGDLTTLSDEWTPGNGTDLPGEDDPPYSPWATVLILLLTGTVIVLTLFGNILVILSVCLNRKLRKPPNFLIINLAISDIAVAALDMPFAAAYQIKKVWIWGPAVCDLWISCDVLACTGSIMTLCMISVDRYMAITRPMTYVNKRTSRLMLLFILIVWVTSAFIGFQPLFIWGGNEHGPEYNFCLISQNPYYTIISTLGAFYLPLSVMLLVYFKIYRAARKSELADLKQRQTATIKRAAVKLNSIDVGRSIDSTRNSNSSNEDTISTSRSQERRPSLPRLAEFISLRTRFSSGSIKKGPRRISLKRERKAAKTLGVILGAFIFCWLPFFIVTLIRPYCSCEINSVLESCLLWLGFLNSLLNPIIYPFFNKDFGPAYRRMLCCSCIRFRTSGNNFYRRTQVTFRQVPLPVNGHDDDSSEDNDSQHSVMVTFQIKHEVDKSEREVNGNVDVEPNDSSVN
ncbi:5-hydroxytryptamine receptor 1F-like [Asterias amurensis]|uniref:5-hydroxytryptamine receptor 1F-like n=1 Tax=Asterias amurensis TaxID=7602 RepID=UPI003AB7416C